MLGAEEKRWLVVGICLSKVLTPVLRNVIAADMEQLLQRSILPPTNIHLQTFTSHSKTLTPSTLRLNYANINNNTTKGSPSNYDYSVRDELSLAKLFVKPFMASFRGFDETLDSSAALSILCGSPNFVLYGIDIFATDVRSEVRNEWGHCKFAIWTEAYYNRCFQLMEDLITHLTYYFPVFSEGEVLEDLKKWKNRGIEMCFDQSINNDVLKLVQDEMATLVKSVEDNKETWVQDHEGLRTNLQNIQQLFGIEIKNLEAKHTALKSGLQRLESRHELLETKVTGLSQGKEDEKDFLKSAGLLWIVLLAVISVLFYLMMLSESNPLRVVLGYWYNQQGPHSKMVSAVVLLVFLLIFLYEHYTKGSMLRYWYCRRGCLKGGRTLSFVYTTHDHQTPKVNGLEFSWENLKKKMNLNFDPRDVPGTHYYINTDRYAYGGVIQVRSLLDNTPQVRGAEVIAVNADCTTVYYEQDGTWRPYISARNIRCISPNT